MSKTTYLGLEKPAESEFYRIQHFNDNADIIDKKVHELENKVGSPFIAQTAAQMTDKTRVYVYVGSESGYTKGNWYYHNGSKWISGGVYNSQGVDTDKNLDVEGKAADAKATGDRLSSITGDLDDGKKTENGDENYNIGGNIRWLQRFFSVPENYDRLTDKFSLEYKTFDNKGAIINGNYLVFPQFIKVEPNTSYCGNNISYFGSVRGYDIDKNVVTNGVTINNKIITTGDNVYYVRISVNDTAVAKNVTFQFGTSATVPKLTMKDIVPDNKTIKNNMLVSGWQNNTILYFHDQNDICKVECINNDGNYLYWTGELLIRGYYSNGWRFDSAMGIVGEDYLKENSEGEICIYIPINYCFVVDILDSTQRLKVLSRNSFDYDRHFLIASSELQGIVKGAILPAITNFSIRTLDYRISEIENKVYNTDSDFIVENRDLQNDSTLMFLWASDTHHQMLANESKYGVTLEKLSEMAQVAQALKADFLLITGDIVNGYNPVTEQKKNLINFVNTLRDNCKSPVLLAEGNHDDNSWYASGNASSSEKTGLEQILNTEQFTNYAMNNSIESLSFDENNPLGGYYYIDFKKSKIRVIVLNCEDIPYIENEDKSMKYYGQWTMAYSEKQLKWLAEKALMFDEDGWGIVFFQHNDKQMSSNTQNVNNLSCLTQIVNAYRNKTNGTAVSTQTDFEANVSYDFRNNKSNEVCAWFAGHTHKDESEVIDGVPHITITNTFNSDGGGYDIVTIDRKNKKVICNRYNGGRLVGYDRTIAY